MQKNVQQAMAHSTARFGSVNIVRATLIFQKISGVSGVMGSLILVRNPFSTLSLLILAWTRLSIGNEDCSLGVVSPNGCLEGFMSGQG